MLCFHIEIRSRNALIRLRQAGLGALFFSLVPVATYAQSGSPFDTGFTNLQTLFTGTIAKVASLIAIVIGGYGFAHGEPGAFCPAQHPIQARRAPFDDLLWDVPHPARVTTGT